MNTHPQISIVIGSYNRRPLLPAVLECIRNNGISVPYEIIVVDGGSNDGSVAYLTRQRDVISIIQHNRGRWRGEPIERKTWGYFLNIGFRAAHGKYILLLSDDTLVVPGAIMNGYNAFEKRLAGGERIGAMAFPFRNFPDDERYFVTQVFGDKIFVNHGLFLVSALKAIDYLDEDNYFMYCADADACLRLLEAGYQTVTAPDSFVEHFKLASESNRGANSERHKRGWEYFKQRWCHLAADPSNLEEHTVNVKAYADHGDASDTVRYFRRSWAYRKHLLKKMIKRLLGA